MYLPNATRFVTADELCKDLQIGENDNVLNKASVNVLLKMIYANSPKMPDIYIKDFINRAKMTGANPFLRQIYLIPRGDSGFVAYSYHFFIYVARKTGELEAMTVTSAPKEIFNPHTRKREEMLVSTAIIKRKGMPEFPFDAHWNEFYNPKNPAWSNMPYIMLQKCAVASALRYCFPEALSGMYIEEEIGEHNYETESIVEITKKNDDAVIEVEKVKEVLQKEEQKDERATAIENTKKWLEEHCNGFTLTMKGAVLVGTGIKTINDLNSKTLDEIRIIAEKIYENVSAMKKEKEKPSFKL